MGSRIQSDYSQPVPDEPAVSSSALIPVVEESKAVVPVSAAADVWKHLQLPKRKAVVLEEDEYVDALEHIVVRDYYPSLLPPDAAAPPSSQGHSELARSTKRPKLSALNEWEDDDRLESPQSGSGKPTPILDLDSSAMPPPQGVPSRRHPGLPKPARDMSLTEFSHTHTSEDNQAFQDLQEKNVEELKEKYFWYQESANQALLLQKRTSGPSSTRSNLPLEWKLSGETTAGSELLSPDGSGPHPPTANISTWNYTARNQLMYSPTGDGIVQPSLSAVRDSPVHLKPSIVSGNTRFPENEISVPSEASAVRDPDNGNKESISSSATGTPHVGGYRLLRTPSPSPHRGGATPVITYGGIVGTPRHLGQIDSDPGPLSSSSLSVKLESLEGGIRYKVPQTPDRDQLAWKLGDQARKSSVRRAQMYAPTPRRPKTPYHLKTPSRTPTGSTSRGRSSGSRSGETIPLSPAAWKLLEKKRKTASGFDKQLRASYQGPSPPK